MENTKHNKSQIGKYYFIMGFIFCLILLTPISCLKQYYFLRLEEASYIAQMMVINSLYKYFDVEGKVPNKLEEVNSDTFDVFLPIHIIILMPGISQVGYFCRVDA